MSRLFVDYGWSMLPMWCQFSIAAYYTVNNIKNIQRAYDTMAYLSHRVRPRGAESTVVPSTADWVWVAPSNALTDAPPDAPPLDTLNVEGQNRHLF